jgi:ABC-type multidrug transport system fused ATPase/permease subunit
LGLRKNLKSYLFYYYKGGEMLNRNKIGLIVGFFFAIVHAIWAFFVAIMPNSLRGFLDWIFVLHSLQPYWVITTFNFLNSLFLVVVTFVFGYLFGYLFAILWNWMHKVSHRATRVRHRRKR